MSFELLTSIKYGKDGKRYKLKKGDIVGRKFFIKKDLKVIWDEGFLKKVKEEPTVNEFTETIDVPQLEDLSKMNVTAAKEFLDGVVHVTELEKYLDQALAEEFPRKTITEFIERRVKEITGSEFLK